MGLVPVLLAACSSSAPTRYVRGPVDTVQAARVGSLGAVLVDGDGMTLYMFTSDHRGQPSTCSSFCAAEWPPLLVTSGDRPVAGPGVRRSLLGTAPRSGGELQATYDGWPLYTWSGDSAPGQATGQGVANAGGQWFVLRPSGQPET